MPTWDCCDHCVPNTLYCQTGHQAPCDTPDCEANYPSCCGLMWYDPACLTCGEDSVETGNREATSNV